MKFIEIVKEGLIMERGAPWEKALKTGKRYLVSDLVHQQINYMMPEHISKKVTSLGEVYRPYKGEDLNGKTLLVWRHGGIGDLLFMMPPLRLLKVAYPDSKLMVGVGGKYIDLYKNIPYVDELHYLPFDIGTLDLADYHLHFEQIIEGNPRAEQMNSYDLFLERFGFNPNEVSSAEKIPDIFLTDQEVRKAQERIDEFNVKESDILIGIQMAASSPIRTFPIEKISAVCEIIAREENGKVILFGSSAQLEMGIGIQQTLPSKYQDRVLVSAKEKFTLRDSMAIARHCDLIIAPDSAMIHIAGALRVPVIGLYGPFPADLRMRYYYNAFAFNAASACAPCFIHDHDPCPKGSPSPCFSLVEAEQIMFAIEHMLNKTGNKSILTISNVKKSIFKNVIDKARKYMKGKGIDVGSGFQKYDPEYDIIRIDVNPIVDPDVLSNFFHPSFEVDDKIDYIISSYAINNPTDLSPFMTKADDILKVGGHIILYVGNVTIIKKAHATKTLSRYLRDYLRSTFTPETLTEAMNLCKNYTLVEEYVPAIEENDSPVMNIFDTPYGIFQVWRKEHEVSREDGCEETSEEIGAELREIEKS